MILQFIRIHHFSSFILEFLKFFEKRQKISAFIENGNVLYLKMSFFRFLGHLHLLRDDFGVESMRGDVLAEVGGADVERRAPPPLGHSHGPLGRGVFLVVGRAARLQRLLQHLDV